MLRRCCDQRTIKKKETHRQKRLGMAAPQSNTARKKYAGSKASKAPASNAVRRPSQRQAPIRKKASASNPQNKFVSRSTGTLDPNREKDGMNIQLFSPPR